LSGSVLAQTHNISFFSLSRIRKVVPPIDIFNGWDALHYIHRDMHLTDPQTAINFHLNAEGQMPIPNDADESHIFG
jgi:hypothetical protein